MSQTTRTEMREEILKAATTHVPFDGWSLKALEAGAADAGFEPVDVKRAFPGGVVEAIVLHSAVADREMVKAFEAMDPPPARTRDKVVALIRRRLEGAERDRDAVRLGLGMLSRPQNAPAGLKALAKTADAIWRAAGDRSTDFNWYTKRGLVSAVYMATVAYWLNDRTEGHAATWSFLERRIDSAMKLPLQAKSIVKRLSDGLPKPGRVAAELRRRRNAGAW